MQPCKDAALLGELEWSSASVRIGIRTGGISGYALEVYAGNLDD